MCWLLIRDPENLHAGLRKIIYRRQFTKNLNFFPTSHFKIFVLKSWKRIRIRRTGTGRPREMNRLNKKPQTQNECTDIQTYTHMKQTPWELC
jgi:hypothetical protein